MLAPDGLEFTLASGFRNNAKTIYKIEMIAQGIQRPGKIESTQIAADSQFNSAFVLREMFMRYSR
jgi:hypothetical protein